MHDTDRTSRDDGPPIGRNDLPLPDSGPPSEASDAPLPGPAGPLRDLGDAPQDPEAERRDELARRSGVGTPSPADRDRPDLVPDLETADRPL